MKCVKSVFDEEEASLVLEGIDVGGIIGKEMRVERIGG